MSQPNEGLCTYPARTCEQHPCSQLPFCVHISSLSVNLALNSAICLLCFCCSSFSAFPFTFSQRRVCGLFTSLCPKLAPLKRAEKGQTEPASLLQAPFPLLHFPISLPWQILNSQSLLFLQKCSLIPLLLFLPPFPSGYDSHVVCSGPWRPTPRSQQPLCFTHNNLWKEHGRRFWVSKEIPGPCAGRSCGGSQAGLCPIPPAP